MKKRTYIDRDFQFRVFKLAKDRGFWDPGKSVLDATKHMAGEFVEFIQVCSDINSTDDRVGEELADICLAALSIAEVLEIDLVSAMINKHEADKSRVNK